MKRQRNKPDTALHEAVIDNLSHDGRGVARIHGKATFIQGALPGEEVQFQYLRTKKDYDEGRTLSVLKPSLSRVDPKCPHYSICGGCSLQHLDEKQQIHVKQEQLLDLLARLGHTEPKTILTPLTSAHWNYRNKARLSVRFVEKKNTAMVGFRERHHPRLIADIRCCPVLNARVDRDIVALRELINKMEDKHSIAQVEVAAGDTEIALIFRHLNPLSVNDKRELTQFAMQYQYTIFLQPGSPETVHRFYPESDSDYLTYELPQYGIRFQFHPTDFTQVNATLNRSMVNLALELMNLNSSDRVLDLFCGLGNFSLPMAKFVSEVVGVEGSKAMVERADMNARANNLSNLRFYTANLDDPAEIKKIISGVFNKVLIDPPRSGALELVKQIDLLNPDRIVYVSCNPVTLARDTEILVHQKGYLLSKAGVMDMFPHTTHVESIALFEKG